MALVYMPNSLPIVDLSAQVSACSLILRLVVMPVERVHTHMAAPHRLGWPQPRTAS